MKREYINGKNYLYKLLYPLLCQTNQNHRNTQGYRNKGVKQAFRKIFFETQQIEDGGMR